jgi:hypothetical protein
VARGPLSLHFINLLWSVLKKKNSFSFLTFLILQLIKLKTEPFQFVAPLDEGDGSLFFRNTKFSLLASNHAVAGNCLFSDFCLALGGNESAANFSSIYAGVVQSQPPTCAMVGRELEIRIGKISESVFSQLNSRLPEAAPARSIGPGVVSAITTPVNDQTLTPTQTQTLAPAPNTGPTIAPTAAIPAVAPAATPNADLTVKVAPVQQDAITPILNSLSLEAIPPTDVTREEIQQAIEDMSSNLRDQPSNVDIVSLIEREYKDPTTPVHLAVNCLLFAVIKGPPQINNLPIAKPLSFIIKVSPRLVSRSLFIISIFLFNLIS